MGLHVRDRVYPASVFGGPVCMVVCENVYIVKGVPVNMSVLWCVHAHVKVGDLGVVSALFSHRPCP